jgi:hypothetical protein
MKKMEMRFAKTVLQLLVFGTCACLTQSVWAQNTAVLKRLFQPKSNEVMELQDKHGPWLILANYFQGDEGRQYALTYAKELRAEFKLPVFIMTREIDTEEVLGRGERVRTLGPGATKTNVVEAKWANSDNNISHAVLIGEFHSKEDPRVGKLTRQIRQFQPKTKIPNFESRMAFMTRNPLLPEDFFQTPMVDSFAEQLNRQEWIRNSLLDCPGRFTVRVASFRGPDILEVSVKTKTKIDEPTSALDKAANKAHKLTESLRGRGVEAYEYHDKFGSYVTIGSFNELGSESDGRFQYDPRILKVISDTRNWSGSILNPVQK